MQEPLPFIDRTRFELMAAAYGQFGELPIEMLVDHVLGLPITACTNLTFRLAALHALQRRWAAAKREQLAVVTRPPSGVFGVYTTARPYSIELSRIDPPMLSCDCLDYLRSALGLCKHAFVVLADALPRRYAERSKALRFHTAPAARAVLREQIERRRRALRFQEAVPGALATLSTLERRLYPYQREGVERLLTSGRLLLADDMGLGKTTQAIAACHALFNSGRVRKGLVVTPASLKPQWLREWNDTTTKVPASIVDGDPDKRAVQYERLSAGFLILNYEQLLRDGHHIAKVQPDIVVLDEAQRIKNYATKSARAVKALTPEYRLALTGTPMENRLEELASILDWIDDTVLAPMWTLIPRYYGRRGNLGDLRARIAPCVLRRVRQDVLSQLPPRTDIHVPVEMTPEQVVRHRDCTQRIAVLASVRERRPLTNVEQLGLLQLLTLQRIVANGLGQVHFDEIWPTYRLVRPTPAFVNSLFMPKLVELQHLLTDLVVEQKRKVVIFSQWQHMLRLAEWSVRELLGDRALRAVFFTGAEKQSLRTKSIAEFHDDPNVAVMFLSDAGGVGLNLQRAASACINLELPWNPAVLEQRIGRIYRLGQSRPIEVFNLVSEGSIESRIADLLGAKQALFDAVFDSTW